MRGKKGGSSNASQLTTNDWITPNACLYKVYTTWPGAPLALHILQCPRNPTHLTQVITSSVESTRPELGVRQWRHAKCAVLGRITGMWLKTRQCKT